MIKPPVLADVTFYVENIGARPSTVNYEPEGTSLPIRRRCTPIVRSRNIREKFFNHLENT